MALSVKGVLSGVFRFMCWLPESHVFRRGKDTRRHREAEPWDDTQMSEAESRGPSASQDTPGAASNRKDSPRSLPAPWLQTAARGSTSGRQVHLHGGSNSLATLAVADCTVLGNADTAVSPLYSTETKLSGTRETCPSTLPFRMHPHPPHLVSPQHLPLAHGAVSQAQSIPCPPSLKEVLKPTRSPYPPQTQTESWCVPGTVLDPAKQGRRNKLRTQGTYD